MTISTILEQACGYSYFVVPRYVLVPRRPLLFSSRQRMQFYFGKRTVSGIAETRICFPFPPLLYTDYFSRTTLAEPGRLSLRLSFPEPFEAYYLKISFSTAKTLQNSEIYNEMDTTTLKCQLEIHTSAFRSLTEAMEKDINQTSKQSRKWRIFHI